MAQYYSFNLFLVIYICFSNYISRLNNLFLISFICFSNYISSYVFARLFLRQYVFLCII